MNAALDLLLLLYPNLDWQGVLTAPTPATSGSELLTDGGLETWASDTDLTNWGESVSGTSTVNKDAAEKRSGSFCARFDVDASNNLVQISQQLTVATGIWLRFTWYAKASAAGHSVWCYGFTGTTPTGIAQACTTSYVAMAQTMRSIAANPIMYFRRYSAPSASLYWDDLSGFALTQASLISTRAMPSYNGTFTAYPTRAPGTQAGIIHYADANNFVIAYLDGSGNLVLDKCVGGTYAASVASTAVTYSAAAPLTLKRSGYGAGCTYTITYNGSAVGSANAVTDTVFDTARNWGVFSTWATNSFGTCKFQGANV